jgi:hypothetical protein
MTNLPPSFRDAPRWAQAPQSILPIAVMDSLMCNRTSEIATSSRPGMTGRDFRKIET